MHPFAPPLAGANVPYLGIQFVQSLRLEDLLTQGRGELDVTNDNLYIWVFQERNSCFFISVLIGSG